MDERATVPRADEKQALPVLRDAVVGGIEDLVAQGVKAGEIVNELAASTGGKGGGRPHFASAGVGDATLLGATRAQTPAIVRRFLKS